MFSNLYLTFSDSAKYADVARNIFLGEGFKSQFIFFGGPPIVLPFFPYSVASFYRFFGVNNFAVVATSFFYFILTLVFVFLLAKKIYQSNLVGILSTIAVGFNYDLIKYATGGASESPFIFEIVAATYFVSLKKKWATFLSLLILVLMYFTRPQAFIYIAGITFYYLILNFKWQKAFIYFCLISILGLVIDKFILTPLTGHYFLYSVLNRGSNILSQVEVGQSASDQLRSGVLTYNFSIIESLKKIFYNLYNFYKLLPQIVSPYMFAMFIIGLFIKVKNDIYEKFKWSALAMIGMTVFVTAASIPFFRYIHPVVPLVYIVAVATIVEIINLQLSIYNEFSIFNFKITKNTFLILSSLFIILFFGVGQTLGVIFLDSRFDAKTHNVTKPPVYVVLSQILKNNTNPNQVVITNLDTWGSWYGNRKTVWFPNEPKQLIDPSTGKIPFDAIYLTGYLIDDQNYYMGTNWRDIFDNPSNPAKWNCDGCKEIAKEFIVKVSSKVDANSNYEKQDSKYILLIKR